MDNGRPPPDLAEEQNSLNSILPAFFTNNVDRSGLDLNFGDCTLQPKDIVDKGDVVRVRYLYSILQFRVNANPSKKIAARKILSMGPSHVGCWSMP